MNMKRIKNKRKQKLKDKKVILDRELVIDKEKELELNPSRVETFVHPKERLQFVRYKLESLNCYPEEILAYITNGDFEKLGCKKEELDIKFRAACAKELMKYVYPTLKTVEVTGPDGTVNLDTKTRKKRIKQLLVKAWGAVEIND